MFDGHHRHKGLLFTGIDKTPVYHGTYIHGNIEELEDQNSDNIITESSKIDKIELTADERSAVNKKYGKVDCSFFKNAKTGKYFCMTHRAGSKEYDLPTDIPIGTVKFVSSTS